MIVSLEQHQTHSIHLHCLNTSINTQKSNNYNETNNQKLIQTSAPTLDNHRSHTIVRTTRRGATLQQTRFGAESTSFSCTVNDFMSASIRPSIGVEMSNKPGEPTVTVPPAHSSLVVSAGPDCN